MSKKMVNAVKKPSGKLLKGDKFIAGDEEYDRETMKKEMRSMKTAGMEKLLEKAEKKMGCSDKPKVKPQKKKAKPVHGQKKMSL